MKKNLLITLLILFCLTGCLKKENNDIKEYQIISGKSTELIELPDAKKIPVDLKDYVKESVILDTIYREKIGSNYYATRTKQTSDGIDYENLLISGDNKELRLDYAKGSKDWQLGSGSTVVMNNRYLYEWLTYSQVSDEEGNFIVKLVRTDGETGKVEIVDEVKQSSPFIYISKIDEENFLFYSTYMIDSDKTDYGVVSSAWIYNINGNKKEIIKEKYENGESWENSDGILLENFAINNGKIYAHGRRRIDGKYVHYLYNYDKDGKLISEEILEGLEDILGGEQAIEFRYMSDYLVFRTYNTLSNFICEIVDGKVKLIAKGVSNQVAYTIVDKYIIFIENNIDQSTDSIVDGYYPLYMLDTTDHEIYAVEFSNPMSNPYFVSLISLSDNTLILEYCDSTYDPANIKQFFISFKYLNKIRFEK